MALRDKGVIKRAIVTPDKHFPLHDVKSINILCKTIEIVKPDIYVDLGDVGEWSAFSAWKYKRKKARPLEFLIEDFDKDVKDVNAGMDIIDESLDKANCEERHITEGNHDNWLNMSVEKYPYVPQYKFKNAVDLKGRGYKYHQFGKHLKIGKGGMILTNDKEAYDWFKLARYEGRHMDRLYKDDSFDMIGWNMYMPPEQAAEGLELFKNISDKNEDLESSGIHKDLSQFPIYERANR